MCPADSTPCGIVRPVGVLSSTEYNTPDARISGRMNPSDLNNQGAPVLLLKTGSVSMKIWRKYRTGILSACALIFCGYSICSWRLHLESDNITIYSEVMPNTQRKDDFVVSPVQNNKRTLMGAGYDGKIKRTLPGDVVFAINNPDLCNRSRNLRYIVYFTSAPGNFMQRTIMRHTWAADNVVSDGMVGRVFLVGQTVDRQVQDALEDENKKYKDIVQGDFLDTYRKLPLKGFMALKWISDFCPNAEYAIKADDDAFVNIFGLIHILEHYQDQPRAILGHCWGYGEKPTSRDHKSEWYLSEEEMPDEFFPDYCIGLLYAISQDIIPELYQAARTTPLVHIEDLYITGLLASKIGNVQHIGFKKNFTFDMVSCKVTSVDLQDRGRDFKHVASECSVPNIPVLWKIYQQRARYQMQLMTNAVLKNTCKIVVIENHPKLKKSCR